MNCLLPTRSNEAKKHSVYVTSFLLCYRLSRIDSYIMSTRNNTRLSLVDSLRKTVFYRRNLPSPREEKVGISLRCTTTRSIHFSFRTVFIHRWTWHNLGVCFRVSGATCMFKCTIHLFSTRIKKLCVEDVCNCTQFLPFSECTHASKWGVEPNAIPCAKTLWKYQIRNALQGRVNVLLSCNKIFPGLCHMHGKVIERTLLIFPWNISITRRMQT